MRWKTLALLAGVAIVGAGLFYPHLKPYQKKRVETFLNPQADVLGAGYHATQSMIAVGSGQGLGKGWGQGHADVPVVPPEQHTDFIFSVWAEEHGFLGCLLLLALYFVLMASAIDIAGNARDRFGALPRGGAHRHALLARRHQHRDGDRAAAGRGRDAAAHELRRLVRGRHLHRDRPARERRDATVRELMAKARPGLRLQGWRVFASACRAGRLAAAR